MPEYKIVDAEQLDASLTDIANEVRMLVDVSSEMNMREITENIAQANVNLSTQNDLVAQIKASLYGKASGSAAELETMIDESSVLENDNPPVESLDEKVERLIDRSVVFNALNYLSFGTNLTVTSIDFYLGNNYVSVNSAFRNNKTVKHLVGINTKYCTTVQYLFTNSVVVSIQEPFDFSSVTSASNANAFVNAYELVDVRIVAGTMKKSNTISSAVLSDESIQSIVDGLADLTGGTQQTLTLNATVTAKLTEDQISTITSKNWVVA